MSGNYESLIEPRIVINGNEVTDPVEKRLWSKYIIHTEYATMTELVSCSAPRCETCKRQCRKLIYLSPKESEQQSHRFCTSCYEEFKNKQPLLEVF